MFYYINDNFKFWTSFLFPIPRRKMKFSTNFAAMLSLVGRIKSSLDCNLSLELHDITHAQYTYAHSLNGRISKLGLHSLQSYGCVRITSWITLVEPVNYKKENVDCIKPQISLTICTTCVSFSRREKKV